MNMKFCNVISRFLPFYTFVFIASSSFLTGCTSDKGSTVEISRAFELRYVTANPRADGETDFKGESEIFTTEQRVEYLYNWARYGRSFFNDPELNKKVVHDEEVASILQGIKPQPTPKVRNKIILDNWKYMGHRAGQHQEERLMLEQWNRIDGVGISDGQLRLESGTFRAAFKDQPWRLKFSWAASVPEKPERVTFRLSELVQVGFDENGRFFYVSDGLEVPLGSYTPGEFYDFEIELDPDGGQTPDYTRTDVTASSKIEINPETYYIFKSHYPAAYAAHGWNFWTAANNSYPQWISYKLEEQRPLTEIRLAFLREDDRTYNYRLEVSDDNINWNPITAEKTSSSDRWTTVLLDQPSTARYVRVFFTGASSPRFRAGLSMAEFHDAAGRVFLADDKPLQGKFNLSVNGQLVADYVPFSHQSPDGGMGKTNFFEVHTSGTVVLDHMYGVGYTLVTGQDVRSYPFEIETFIDTDFSVRPSSEGFQNASYDDTDWRIVPYNRYAHGGERHKEEALYLRRTVRIGEFERAVLNVETVRPAADIYINGRLIRKVGEYPEQIDVTDVLIPNRDNLIAVRVQPYRVDKVQYHMSADPWTGWFAGLMEIDLTKPTYIDDVFAYADYVGNPARVQLQARLVSENNESFNGRITTRLYHWFPEESGTVAGQSTRPIQIESGSAIDFSDEILIPDPKLWSIKTPNLYKVHVILQDDSGVEIDDFVITTGLRTVSQEGGTFRINGRPEMLNGPLLFGHHSPLERIAQWMFSPPEERYVHDILLTKRMNGTSIRMSVHDRRVAGVNDRRLAQIGDQMGIMFMWQTPTWVREGTVNDFDFVGLPLYARQVRNHPSIVMWQPGNHPSPYYSMEWFQRVHDTLAAVDPTRLISPSADLSRMESDFAALATETSPSMTRGPADKDDTWPAWTSPLNARGTMERVLGYGQNWSDIRNLPGMHTFRGMQRELRQEYLISETHAWFDFESEETIAQPNWNLSRGKPWHKMYSYEIGYDVGSIGRKLNFDEWQESQAWQALSAYEAYRKKRWLDFDGMSWCPLRGGGNTATYMKPLLDYDNYPKLGYYAVQMSFQPILAGSSNVDIVYGPNDTIPVMILHNGDKRTVDVIVRANTMNGVTVAETVFKAIDLPDTRGMLHLGEWKPNLPAETYYAFEYVVRSADSRRTR
jgi:hypothetical protein